MTQPDGFFPESAYNFGSLADLAARDESSWNTFIRTQALSGHTDLLNQLYDGLPQNQGINLQSVFIQQMFLRLFNCNPGGVDLSSTLDNAQGSVADALGGLNGDPAAPYGINLLQTAFAFLCGCTPTGTTADETIDSIHNQFETAIGVPYPSGDPMGVAVGNMLLKRYLPAAPAGTSGATILNRISTGINDFLHLLGNPTGMGGTDPGKSTQIPWAQITGISGPVDLGTSVQTVIDYLWSAFSQADGHGKTLALLFGAAAQLTQDSASAIALAEAGSELWFKRAITKPTYLAIDPSADAVFNISTLTGAVPTTVNVAAGKSVIGIIGTPDAGLKKSVCWIGQSTTGITAMYIRIYSINLTTNVFSRIHESANIIAGVDDSLEWNYYNFPSSSDWFNAAQNTWYAVEMMVTGTGTYKVVGMPNHWLPANAGVIPRGMAAEVSSPVHPAPATISSPTYSVNVPWFALVGAEGVSLHSPKLRVFGDSGTYLYDIPPWSTDLVIVGNGAAGGGQACGLLWGEGGKPGNWSAVHLVRGVNIPSSTMTLTVKPGIGGNPGAGISTPGSAGGATTVTGTGWAGLSAAGGAGGSAGNADYPGKSPGNFNFEGMPYKGGDQQNAIGANGIEPGGGGSGATIIPFAGGRGADGAVWITASQIV